MTETRHIHHCFVPVAVFFMVGLVIGVRLPGHGWVATICTVLTAVGLMRVTWRKAAALGWPLLFCIGLGYLCVQPWLGVRMPARHISRFADQGVWHIQGEVVDTPQWDGRRLQFVMAATGLSQKALHLPVSGRIKVTARDDLPHVQCGDEVALSGRLRSIRNFANPGGFDYVRFMALRGIRARVYARQGSLTVEKPALTRPWQSKLDALRQNLAHRMDAAVGQRDSDAATLLKALIIGQRDKVSPQLRQAFNAAGVSHVLAISGLHIGMVTAAAFGVARWLLCWVPLMLTRGWTRKGAAIVSFFAVLFYALLAGMSPSTQRATIMVAVVLMGYWVGRRHNWFNGLALAALIILMVYPPALLSISFQLSFMAVLAIVVGLTIVPVNSLPMQAPWWRRWVQRWVAFMWVSALAIGGTLPLSLYYFNQASLMGLVTNLVVVPLVGLVVVPAGLLGVLASIISSLLAEMLWVVAVAGIEMILKVVHWAALWPWSSLHSVTPSIAEILLYYASTGIAFGWSKIPRWKWVLLGICALWLADATYWCHQRFGRQDLRVTAIDVGQGTANLLQLPGGYVVLVDGGGFSDNTIFDVGERILAPLLWRQKIKQVDLVVLSHPNSDHLNGLLYILHHFNVPEIWSTHRPARTLGYRRWTQYIQNNRIKHTAFDDLPVRQVRHGVRFHILSPPGDFMTQVSSGPWRDHNNCSLVLQVGMGEVTFLFAGDITAPAEVDLVRRHGPDELGSTILMVPHHGSRYSSTPPFLKSVGPKEAIISSGWHNRFGFPHGQVLHRLEMIQARMWCTAECGAIEIDTDGRTYEMKTFRPGSYGCGSRGSGASGK